MKKIFLLIALFLLCGTLAGCGNQNGENQENPGQTLEHQNTGAGSEDLPGSGEEVSDRSSIAAQLELIADNMELWADFAEYANEVYAYTVTDLDLNGRLEIIAAHAGGTGIYTYSRYFEVNSTYDGLEECERDWQEGTSEADIITGSVCVYLDAQSGVIYYIFDDYLKNGAAEYYESIIAVSLTEGRITEEVLANRSTIYTDPDAEPQIGIWNGQQQEISEEEYENMADNVFADCEQKWIVITWLTFPEQDGAQQPGDWSREELMEKLQECYDGFMEYMA